MKQEAWSSISQANWVVQWYNFIVTIATAILPNQTKKKKNQAKLSSLPQMQWHRHGSNFSHVLYISAISMRCSYYDEVLTFTCHKCNRSKKQWCPPTSQWANQTCHQSTSLYDPSKMNKRNCSQRWNLPQVEHPKTECRIICCLRHPFKLKCNVHAVQYRRIEVKSSKAKWSKVTKKSKRSKATNWN